VIVGVVVGVVVVDVGGVVGVALVAIVVGCVVVVVVASGVVVRVVISGIDVVDAVVVNIVGVAVADGSVCFFFVFC